MNICWEDSTFA